MDFHNCDFDTDAEGWVTVRCSCGWSEGPFDGASDAGTAWGDHRADVGRRDS